eukprot:CAMPEP_0202861422 /NCGR_PEP_ID=MMETSP1391-20130828/2831_1 /ASSEMBLY_ACC=CAM_ASM_000867 /TAXON_ID=1034604 /ORGANISM="Chlamydomonas leiostraca, Strain SAG 11-49" /LENGTH=262 /DNA_ID=CAMNT_0049540813 /DNA_START=156 /DNA_END=941 /DNA_ORIENTATION=-
MGTSQADGGGVYRGGTKEGARQAQEDSVEAVPAVEEDDEQEQEEQVEVAASSRPERPAAPEATASAAAKKMKLTSDQLSQLWSACSRALMKLGKGGAQESHIRSLGELVGAHTLVKVQLNGDLSGLQQVAGDLASGGNAVLLGTQGPHMLFAKAGMSGAELLAHAGQESTKIATYHQGKLEAKKAKEAAREARESGGAPGGSGSSSGASGAAASGARGGGAAKDKGIDRLISQVVAPARGGPLTKGKLVQEWDQLSAAIAQA